MTTENKNTCKIKDYGLKPSLGGVRDYEFFTCCGNSKSELPSRFLLPIDEWATVLDQGIISACPAFATSTAYECHYYKETGESVIWSPGRTYGHEECRPGYDGKGMYLSSVMKGLTKIGFVPSSIFNILEEMPIMKEIVRGRTDLDAIGSQHKLKGFVKINYALESKKIEAMKRALYQYQVPLVVASYDYFGVGHAFVIYGWDDDWTHKKAHKGTQIFAFRNSWGKDYEDNGNSTIPVTYIDECYLPIFADMPMPFADVHESDWFYDDVKKAVFSGLVKGVSDTEFLPHDDMIRGDLAVVIDRMLNKMVYSFNSFIKTLNQKDIEAHPITLKDDAFSFADVSDLDYYAKSISMVCANGIMNGVGDNFFEPQRSITRGEIATILCRTYDLAIGLLKASVPTISLSIDFANNPIIKMDDVDDTQWFSPFVTQAIRLGLMNGDGDGKFRPHDNIIRAECSSVLNRLFKLIDNVLMEINRKYD